VLCAVLLLSPNILLPPLAAAAAAAAAAEGDTLRTWRIDPYLMIEGGQAWLPPPMLAADLAAGEALH
jgi:hypothetical protein